MKVVVAGTRTFTDYPQVAHAIKDSGFLITELISGGADGVDSLGELYAEYHHIPVKRFLADWRKHGKAAGPIRNEEMAKYVGPEGGLVLIWTGQSRGSASMKRFAQQYKLKIFERIVK